MSKISILITGGTGSFGTKFIKHLIKNHKSKIRRLVIFSRDELKQYKLQKSFPVEKYKFMRFFIGDVRDKSRLKMALNDIDVIIHSAALKQVDTAEYNPIETIKTNIVGSQNIIEAAIDSKVKNVIAISTDKAVSPINLYGASKLCSEKLFLAANSLSGKKNIKFSVVRYGNVMGSRGSVLPFFLSLNKKKLPLTDKKMTRFNINLEDACELVYQIMFKNFGGEIYVPKIPSFYISDLIKAINNKNTYKIVGIRPGEKLYEELINFDESQYSIELKKYFLIFPNMSLKKLKIFALKTKGRLSKSKFSYNSLNNRNFLNINDLKKLIIKFKNERAANSSS
ncbi:UDP-N-acetylglucosamine 4,6-dehydratase (inverting) [Candidatus Pelagibacter sp.]|nr:UDP-N-acetylglucosamine 4,6-dehydratase (inverting) [Candidatus Pelagibacter sp.]